MNCKQCNQPIAENELFCKHCGFQGSVAAQQQKVGEAKAKTNGVILGQCKSVLFLVFSICFSVITLFQFFDLCDYGGVVDLLYDILYLAMMIVTTIGLWKTFASKDKAGLSLKGASMYDQLQSVMNTINFVLSIVVTAIAVVLVAIGGDAIADVLGAVGVDVGGGVVTAVLIVMFVGACFIAYYIVVKKFYANRRAYFLALDRCATAGETYKEEKAPVVGSYILGGFAALGAISSLAMSSALSEVAGALGDIEFLSGFVGGMATGSFVSSLLDIATAGYYIVSAIWMSKVHSEVVAATAEENREVAKLADITSKTKVAIADYEKEKELAHKREMQAAEEEVKKAQVSMQEQQQMMMQMMMQQMMANNAAAAAAAAAPAAPAEAPTQE